MHKDRHCSDPAYNDLKGVEGKNVFHLYGISSFILLQSEQAGCSVANKGFLCFSFNKKDVTKHKTPDHHFKKLIYVANFYITPGVPK